MSCTVVKPAPHRCWPSGDEGAVVRCDECGTYWTVMWDGYRHTRKRELRRLGIEVRDDVEGIERIATLEAALRDERALSYALTIECRDAYREARERRDVAHPVPKPAPPRPAPPRFPARRRWWRKTSQEETTQGETA